MRSYTQKPNSDFSITTITVEDNKLVISVNNRKNADKVCDLLLACIKFSKFGTSAPLAIAVRVCDDLPKEEKTSYPSPHKMVLVTGDIKSAIKNLKKHITPELFEEINRDLGSDKINLNEESKEQSFSGLDNTKPF